ncbi:hypothetical protein ISN75_09545 [Dyella marensis]|uniref:hypothetical protein n=1 Tax=Dyella marensis TaxID=500610 RepID=UPI0031D29241
MPVLSHKAMAMTQDRLAAYQAFCRDCRGDFRRIARKAGDCDADDVACEAWLMAAAFEAGGAGVDFADADFRQRLLAHLFQHFVRYNDRRIAAALRFEVEDEALPLLERLAAPTPDPLSVALATEEHVDMPLPSYRHSQAAAWASFISVRGGHMPTVARHLMISLSWCYRRYTRALRLAETQWPLPDGLPVPPGEQPQPWRRYRAMRTPHQFSFDFDPVLALDVPLADQRFQFLEGGPWQAPPLLGRIDL